MQFFRALIIICILSPCLTYAQEGGPPRIGSRVIDDTTKQVYGPTTSKYYYERDVFYNREVLHPIDTFIQNFHRYTYVERMNYRYQDLGNIGTAIRPVFFQAPTNIGVSSGFESYDLYWDTEVIKYFDTKSPYSNMKVILGGKGRSMTRASFSRNINPRWNFGFNYRGIFIDKQILRRGKGDRHVRGNYYDAYTAYQTKDSTYRIFLNFKRGKHQVDEYGGVITPDDPTIADFFDENLQPMLTEAESRELRINVHLFHQYSVGKGLQVYHVMDRYRQGVNFFDTPSAAPSGYYDFTEVDSAFTHDAATFKTFRNEAGVKGSLLKLFYNGYYAIRNYSMDYKYLDEDTLRIETKGSEHYLGGRMSLKLDSLVEVNGWGEIIQDGNYRIEGNIKSKWFEASIKQNQSAPGFVYQAYRGSHDIWSNDFDDLEISQLNGFIHYRSKTITLSPGLTFTRLRNYVYFKEEPGAEGQKVLPYQTSGNHIIFSPEFRFSLTFFRHITLRGTAIYTKLVENADDAMRVPDIMLNGQLSYANIFFNGNCDLHTGFDVHWKEAYYAPGYDPVIQQFYTQTSFLVPDFPIVDVFVNVKIKRGRIFFKYHNLVNAFNSKSGYIPTPEYSGQRNIFDFGFDWSFYD